MVVWTNKVPMRYFHLPQLPCFYWNKISMKASRKTKDLLPEPTKGPDHPQETSWLGSFGGLQPTVVRDQVHKSKYS